MAGQLLRLGDGMHGGAHAWPRPLLVALCLHPAPWRTHTGELANDMAGALPRCHPTLSHIMRIPVPVPGSPQGHWEGCQQHAFLPLICPTFLSLICPLFPCPRRVTGKDAVGFFEKSELGREVLFKVWWGLVWERSWGGISLGRCSSKFGG